MSIDLTVKKELKKDIYSHVWLANDGWVYKRQHEFMTDNEIYFLKLMAPSGYVPHAEQVGRDLIKLKYIHNSGGRKYREFFLENTGKMLMALREAGIRHGDLTEYSIVIDDRFDPYIIDFAESRFWDDPRPDKRPEGDDYWLPLAMQKIYNGETFHATQ